MPERTLSPLQARRRARAAARARVAALAGDHASELRRYVKAAFPPAERAVLGDALAALDRLAAFAAGAEHVPPRSAAACGTCHGTGRVEEPDAFSAADLAVFARAAARYYKYPVGSRLPSNVLGWLLGVSRRSVDMYLRGETRMPWKVRRRALLHVAHLAKRRLPLLPPEYERRRLVLVAAHARGQRALARQGRNAQPTNGGGQRKTRDEWRLYVNYGYGDGWEFECAEDSRTEIMQRLAEYRTNAPQWPARVRKHRVLLLPGEQRGRNAQDPLQGSGRRVGCGGPAGRTPKPEKEK